MSIEKTEGNPGNKDILSNKIVITDSTTSSDKGSYCLKQREVTSVDSAFTVNKNKPWRMIIKRSILNVGSSGEDIS